MNSDIIEIVSDEQIRLCFPAIQALRPHLDVEGALDQIQRQRAQGYRLFGVRMPNALGEQQIPSIIGFRYGEFLAWGKIIYIDDLSTVEAARGLGHAGLLLDHAVHIARELSCQAVHLDSGYARQAAHRLYLNKGFVLSSHHFALTL